MKPAPLACALIGVAPLLSLLACSNGTGAGSAGLGLPGTACASPVDITRGGSFSGDTCAAAVSVPVEGCGQGARAQIFEVAPEPQSWNRVFSVTPGFTLAGSASTCSFSSADCDAGGIGGGSVAEGTAWYLAAFLEDGGCGPFTVQVINASSCSDRANASSCTCGSMPACSVGSSCHLSGTATAGSCVSQ